MKAIHASLYEEAREKIEVRHPQWQDRITLFDSGYFSRRNSACFGTWQRSCEDELCLDWFDWPSEIFHLRPNSEDQNGVKLYYLRISSDRDPILV